MKLTPCLNADCHHAVPTANGAANLCRECRENMQRRFNRELNNDRDIDGILNCIYRTDVVNGKCETRAAGNRRPLNQKSGN